MKTTNRICIYPKDIQNITGKSYRHSRELLEKIKRQLQKEPNQIVTVNEVCNYLGISVEEVKKIIY